MKMRRRLIFMKMLHSHRDMVRVFHAHISRLLVTRRHYVVRAIFALPCLCYILFISYILASWHRGSNGILIRGTLTHEEHCPCRFEIYYPYDLKQCPKILLVSRSPHWHPDPPLSKTPKPIIQVFHSLLDSLRW